MLGKWVSFFIYKAMEDLSKKRTCKLKDMKKVKDKAQGYLEDKIFKANRRATAKAPPMEKAVTKNRGEAVWLEQSEQDREQEKRSERFREQQWVSDHRRTWGSL